MTRAPYRCGCTTVDRAACTTTDALAGRRPDGACDCSCHGEYADDPENWRPLFIADMNLAAEIQDSYDLEDRTVAAERLIEELPS